MSRMSDIALFLEEKLGQFLTRAEIITEVGETGLDYLVGCGYLTLQETQSGIRYEVCSV